MRFGAPKETLFKTMDSNFQESINIQDNNKYLNPLEISKIEKFI